MDSIAHNIAERGSKVNHNLELIAAPHSRKLTNDS